MSDVPIVLTRDLLLKIRAAFEADGHYASPLAVIDFILEANPESVAALIKEEK